MIPQTNTPQASQPQIKPATQALIATAQTLATQLSAASSHPQSSGDPLPQHQVQTLLTALPKLAAEDRPAALSWLTLRAAFSAARATELFEALQLRAGLAQAFPAFNLHGEQAWKAAAQTRLLLQTDLTPLTQTVADPSFWQDPDTRWLAAVDSTNQYLNKEAFEALLTLMAFPTQSETQPTIRAVEQAGYKIEALLKPNALPQKSTQDVTPGKQI